MVVMPMASRPSLFRSTLMLTGVGVASQFFGFLYRIAMARLAGAEVLGLYQLILPAYAVIQSVCISGLAVAVSVLSAEFYARGNHAALRQSVSAGLRGMAALWLPLAAAVVSSLRNIPIPADWALIGEIGLTGEVRAVGMMDRRVSECARMGFTHLIVPKANLRALHAPEGVEIRGVSTLYEALAVLF